MRGGNWNVDGADECEPKAQTDERIDLASNGAEAESPSNSSSDKPVIDRENFLIRDELERNLCDRLDLHGCDRL